MTKIRFDRPTTFVTKALIAGLLFAGSASARPGGEGKGPRHGGKDRGHFFEKADVDRDGKIQKAEAEKMAQERFNRIDANKDGVVTQEEAKKLAEAMKQKKGGGLDARIDELFERADKNKNGRVEKSESRLPAEKFDRVDTNKDGAVTKAEMKAAFARLGADHGKKRFEKMDTNGDGKISRDEALTKAREHFAKMDQNEDGAVTREEARAAMPGLHKKGHRHPQEDRGQQPRSKKSGHRLDRAAGAELAKNFGHRAGHAVGRDQESRVEQTRSRA